MKGWAIIPSTGSLGEKADQRAPYRQAGDEGAGAVDRVEHPDVFGVGVFGPELLADDAVRRESSP